MIYGAKGLTSDVVAMNHKIFTHVRFVNASHNSCSFITETNFQFSTFMEKVTVAVIGNGPSGILMSLLLSGYFLNPINGDKFSDCLEKAEKAIGRRLILSEGIFFLFSISTFYQLELYLRLDARKFSQPLKGRSENPFALLFDDAFHPGSDTGRKSLPTLDVTRPRDCGDAKSGNPESCNANANSSPNAANSGLGLSHVVFGQAALGGSWNAMQSNLICLSPKNWMYASNHCLFLFFSVLFFLFFSSFLFLNFNFTILTSHS
jgi:hypothetical protein